MASCRMPACVVSRHTSQGKQPVDTGAASQYSGLGIRGRRGAVIGCRRETRPEILGIERGCRKGILNVGRFRTGSEVNPGLYQ